MAKTRKYDVIVRVNYTYENEYGDKREAYACAAGLATTNDHTPEELMEWVATRIEFNPPNDTIKKLLHTELAMYTYNEVK